ncbi:MAG TPA: hypothetical protein VJN18_19820 [Polyangiaceae bacterium]|nr:hypothetical protein [Polyangiaceae bacterium]
MHDSSGELDRLLEVERGIAAASRADRDRNRRALARRLSLAGALGASAAEAGRLGWLASSASVKFIATIALVAGGSGGVAWLVSPAPRPNAYSQRPRIETTPVAAAVSLASAAVTAPSVAPFEVPPSSASPVLSQPLTSTGVPSHRDVGPAPSAAAFPAEPGDSLAGETRLLGQAQAAVRAGQASRALELLDRAAQLYPTGVLQEEVGATRVFAWCQLGQHTQAEAAASSFFERFPRSLLADRVRQSCASRVHP